MQIIRFFNTENKMPIAATIEQPTREKYRIALEPAQNAFASMVLVTKKEEMPGISPWVAQTRAAMAPEEITIRINLGLGRADGVVWTSDLSYDYVKINAEYRS